MRGLQRTNLHRIPIFVEGLGSGVLYSLNYERLVVDELGLRAGMSHLWFSSTADKAVTGPSTASTLFIFRLTVDYIGVRDGKHCMEFGGGATIVHVSTEENGPAGSTFVHAEGTDTDVWGTVHLGYRLHPVDGGASSSASARW